MNRLGLTVVGVGLIIVLIGLVSPLSGTNLTVLSGVSASISISPSSGPVGTSVTVTLNGYWPYGANEVLFAGTRVASTCGPCTFSVPNNTPGTYSVAAYNQGPGVTGDYYATFTVTTVPTTTSTTATSTPPPATYYTTTFTESGLPAGTTWSVTYAGSTGSGTGPISFTTLYGSYSFAAVPVAGYSASPSSGSLVSGSTQSIVFSSTATTTTSGAPLAISGSAFPISGTIPLAVSFVVSASGGSGSYSYLWSFGDGGTASTSTAAHTYSAGSYTASIKVTDSAGNAQTASFTITASAPATTTTTTSIVTTTNSLGSTTTYVSTAVVSVSQSQTSAGVARFSSAQGATPNVVVLFAGLAVVAAGAFISRPRRGK